MLNSNQRICGVYEQVLDTAFEKHFPAWKTFSSADPIRLFAESLQESLAAIEVRQQRLAGVLLDSLPTLVGMEPQEGKLSRGLVQLVASPKLKQSQVLGEGTVLRFHSDRGELRLVLTQETTVSAVRDFTVVAEGKKLKLTFEASECEELSLTYFPESHASAKRIVKSSAVILEDATQAFTRRGTLRLAIAPGIQSVEIQFETDFKGQLKLGVATVEFQAHCKDVQLGSLQGDPWEKLPLPASVLSVPKKLRLRFPDERVVELSRGGDELLRVRNTDSQAFDQLFFFNTVGQSLVIPAADKWMRGYGGGPIVEALDVTLASELEWLPADASFAGDFPKVLAEVVPLMMLHGCVAREDSSGYLSRFYSAVRALGARQEAFDIERVRFQTLVSVPGLRALEYDAQGQNLTFFALTHLLPEEEGGDEQTAVLKEVEHQLRAKIPLRFGLRVRPFRTTVLRGVEGIDDLDRLLQPPPIGTLAPGKAVRLSQCVSVGDEGLLTNEVRRLPGEIFRYE